MGYQVVQMMGGLMSMASYEAGSNQAELNLSSQ